MKAGLTLVKAQTSFTIMPRTWVPKMPGETRPYFGESADKLHYNAMNMGSKLPDKPGFTLVKAQTSFTIKYNAMNRGQLLLSLPWKKHTRVSHRNNFPAGN